jgi:hypothetical protein
VSPIKGPASAAKVPTMISEGAIASESQHESRPRPRIRKTNLFRKDQVDVVDHAKRVLSLALGRDVEFSDVLGMLIDEDLPELVRRKQAPAPTEERRPRASRPRARRGKS